MLVLVLCHHAPGGRNIVMVGDTCQTISRTSFRFCDLQNLFFQQRERERKAGGGAQCLTRVPDIDQLAVNFRSHHGILRAANAVVETLHMLFPGSVDTLAQERGAFDGTRPLLLPDFELHTLSRFVKAKMGTEMNASIDFGANQVVIVRSSAAKARLPAEFADCLVLAWVGVWAYKNMFICLC